MTLTWKWLFVFLVSLGGLVGCGKGEGVVREIEVEAGLPAWLSRDPTRFAELFRAVGYAELELRSRSGGLLRQRVPLNRGMEIPLPPQFLKTTDEDVISVELGLWGTEPGWPGGPRLILRGHQQMTLIRGRPRTKLTLKLTLRRVAPST